MKPTHPLDGEEIFMIRDSVTGTYSTGGEPPTFTKFRCGKVWRSRGALLKHLAAMDRSIRLYKDAAAYVYPPSCEVLCFQVTVPKTITSLSKFNRERRTQ